MTRRKMPNCGICTWSEEAIMIGTGILNKGQKSNERLCTAQADRVCKVVYNNRLCRKLFKEEGNLNEI